MKIMKKRIFYFDNRSCFNNNSFWDFKSENNRDSSSLQKSIRFVPMASFKEKPRDEL